MLQLQTIIANVTNYLANRVVKPTVDKIKIISVEDPRRWTTQ